MNSADLILLVGVMPLLLVLSGLVSASETALFGLTQNDRESLSESRPRAGAAAQALLDRPRSLLTAILLANMLVNVSYFSLSSIVVLSFERADHPYGATAVGVGSLLAIVLFGEVIAKTTASAHRIGFSALIAPIWLLIIQVLWPLWSAIDRFVMAPMTRLVSARPVPAHSIDADELRHIVSGGGDQHAIDADEQRLLLDVFRLGTLRVREVMTPRVRLPSLSVQADREAVLQLIREQRPERILVYDDREAIQGLLHPATYFRATHANKKLPLAEIIEHPLYIPEQARLDDALEQLRTGGTDHAGVVDERGELVGVLRVEDVVAELIDEAQESTASTEFRIAGIGEFVVPGDAPAAALLVDIDPTISSHLVGNLGRVTTIAGVVLALLGRLPEEGDSVRIGALELIVHELDDRAITSVIVRMSQPAHGGQGEGAP